MSPRSSNKEITQELKAQWQILLSFAGIFWLIYIIDTFIIPTYSLNQYGIIPRNLIGLRGVLLAPFLHGNLSHLVGNTIPFLILGWLVMLQQISDFWRVTGLSMLVGGLGTWLIGQPQSVHIGSSILIFGYLGFLLFRGYFQRNMPSIALSIVVGIFYGSYIFGVIPGQQGVSWQGHLFGFIGGVIAAYLIAKRSPS